MYGINVKLFARIDQLPTLSLCLTLPLGGPTFFISACCAANSLLNILNPSAISDLSVLATAFEMAVFSTLLNHRPAVLSSHSFLTFCIDLPTLSAKATASTPLASNDGGIGNDARTKEKRAHVSEVHGF